MSLTPVLITDRKPVNVYVPTDTTCYARYLNFNQEFESVKDLALYVVSTSLVDSIHDYQHQKRDMEIIQSDGDIQTLLTNRGVRYETKYLEFKLINVKKSGLSNIPDIEFNESYPDHKGLVRHIHTSMRLKEVRSPVANTDVQYRGLTYNDLFERNQYREYLNAALVTYDEV